MIFYPIEGAYPSSAFGTATPRYHKPIEACSSKQKWLHVDRLKSQTSNINTKKVYSLDSSRTKIGENNEIHFIYLAFSHNFQVVSVPFAWINGNLLFYSEFIKYKTWWNSHLVKWVDSWWNRKNLGEIGYILVKWVDSWWNQKYLGEIIKWPLPETFLLIWHFKQSRQIKI